MEHADDDRRGYPRSLIELKVTYKRLNTFFHDYTRNISKGGTFIRTERPLDIDTEFLFKLLVPELLEPLTLKGKVKWVVTGEDEGGEEGPGMGIQFLYETEDERLRVEATVERLMKRSLGERAFSKLMERS